MNERRHVGLLYVLPAAAVYVPLLVIPLAYSMALSLHRWDGLALTWEWAGLTNYAEMLGDSVFWRALAHNIILVIASLGLQLPIAMLLAVLLSKSGRLMRVIRTAIAIPYILPTVIIALVWKLIFSNAMPTALGSTTWSLPVVIFVISWRFVGFHMLLFLAGLAAVDPELEEAARLDGAGEWACFRHVTMPLLRPVIVVSATLSIVGSMKYFDIIYVMTNGGPAHATELLATYMVKQSFDSRFFGYGSALAVTMTLLALGGLGLAALLFRRRS